MSAPIDRAMLQPGALPPVPVKCGADRFDNFIREYGIGYCCEWFGHEFDGEFAAFTVHTLQERNDEAALAAGGAA